MCLLAGREHTGGGGAVLPLVTRGFHNTTQPRSDESVKQGKQHASLPRLPQYQVIISSQAVRVRPCEHGRVLRRRSACSFCQGKHGSSHQHGLTSNHALAVVPGFVAAVERTASSCCNTRASHGFCQPGRATAPAKVSCSPAVCVPAQNPKPWVVQQNCSPTCRWRALSTQVKRHGQPATAVGMCSKPRVGSRAHSPSQHMLAYITVMMTVPSTHPLSANRVAVHQSVNLSR